MVKVSTGLKMNTKYNWLILAGALVILLMVLKPLITQVQEKRAEQKSLVEKLKVLSLKRKTLEGIDEQLITERVMKMETVFPSKKPIIQLLSNLSLVAGENDLVFGGISLRPGVLGEEESDSSLKDISFGFKLQGTFKQINDFMYDLENTAPLMKIDEMSLTVKTNPLERTKILIVAAEIKVSAFYQAPPEKLGRISTPVVLLSRADEALLNRLIKFKTYRTVLPEAPTGKVDLFTL